MISIDTREGGPNCGEEQPRLQSLFSTHRLRPQHRFQRLYAGDFSFTGSGPNSTPYLIGVERKRIYDMLSCIRTGHFSGEQLPKLLEHYDAAYLLLEGQWLTDDTTGALLQWGRDANGRSCKIPMRLGRDSQPFQTQELFGFLNTIQMCTPIRLVRTYDRIDTVNAVCMLWDWWQKDWEKHRAHQALYTPQTTVSLGKAGTVRRVAAQLKGVGWEKSGLAAFRFRSVGEAAGVKEYHPLEETAAEWGKLPGFGKKLSTRVVKELRGEYDSGDGFE